MKTSISKAVQQTVVQFEVKGYFIRGYTFQQHDPNNLKTAKLTVLYDLTGTDADGRIVLSPMPEHQGIKIELHDVGGTEHLTDFLRHSGTGEEDLFDFNYHDIQQIVERDIAAKFKISV